MLEINMLLQVCPPADRARSIQEVSLQHITLGYVY